LLLVSGNAPAGEAIVSYLQIGRPDSECWLLALLVFTLVALAIPNLNNISNKTFYCVFFVCLVAQPILLVMFRWPVLASNTWSYTDSLFLTVVVYAMPGLAICAQTFRNVRATGLYWPILVVSLVLCLLFDLQRVLGLNHNTLLIQSGSSPSIPWGLVLTLIVSGWLSSLLIPHWFLWSSKSEPLLDDRALKLKIFWNSFYPYAPKIYLWPTGCRSANAVLVGSMISKKLLLTDRLLLTFHQREMEWITLHELAHVTRHHQIIRLLPTAMALPALYLILSQTDGLTLLASSLALFVTFAGLIVATCWWTEWDADAQAIKRGSQFHKIDLATAGREYASVLRKLYGSNGTPRTSWTHPSLIHRLRAIRKLVDHNRLSRDYASR
jgi:Zn-dependent protease with chaperone function